MRKLLIALTLALAGSQMAFADSMPAAVDAKNYEGTRWKVEVFNDSGRTLASGSVVVWDQADNDLVQNLRPYVTTSTTVDDIHTAGVIINPSCPDQTQCEIVVYGPALVRCLDATDAVGVNTTVGNSTSADGLCGDFTPAANKRSLGTALGAGNGTDHEYIPVFVNTLGAPAEQ